METYGRNHRDLDVHLLKLMEIYNCGDFVVYKETVSKIGRILAIVEMHGELKIIIQHILRFDELPKNLQSNDHRKRSHIEVWLLDQEIENAVITIELQKIIKHITITILYNDDAINKLSSIIIQEILYKYQGHLKLKSIMYSYHHPSEFAPLDPLKEPVTQLPVYKLYIDMYYDDFGTFCSVYHSLGGVYIQIGNMSFKERKKLKNHFVLGFVPFGGCFEEFIEPFISEMKKLENGCRTCNTTKDSFTSNNLDLQSISWYHYQTDEQFKEIFAASTITERKEIATQYGLCLQSTIIDQLRWERHLHSRNL
ncbi:hypothetical protein RhiirA4_480345 [Rhizophagus irregularis]|uniref:Uncharacterized protein n=1 Tax=Rhizophagus irregularis TaxID=588596 RepID=A0A2I1HHV4_9GLOM|nr:hypothetical protein RhiirA4_480345 [Rhizophagus irregularis]